MKIHGSELIEEGQCAIVRDQKVVWIGRSDIFADHFQEGDILCVDLETYFTLQAIVGVANEEEVLKMGGESK